MNILRLIPDGGGPAVEIDQDLSRVGRDSGSDIHLRDASVSRQHAEIERREDDWSIVDLNSGNGTRLDGERIHEATLLPGQKLHIGNLCFRVEIDRGTDGATMMLGRSPLLTPPADQTVLSSGPPVFPPPPPKAPEPPKKDWLLPAAVFGAVVVGLVLAGVAFRITRRPAQVPEAALAPIAEASATPTITPDPTPAPTATPTPTPRPAPPRPLGSLLVTSDVDTRVFIDGRFAAILKASGLRRFRVAPGEHIVQFRSEAGQVEVVVRVRVNEQTVARRTADGVTPR